MLDLLLKPAKAFVETGIEAFRKSKEHKNLLIAVQDRIRREVRFNITLLNEFLTVKADGTAKHDHTVREALIRSLRSDGFDQIDSGMVPLKLFFEDELTGAIWPKAGFKPADLKLFMTWVGKDKSQYDLLERIYHRIRLTKTFAECGKVQGSMEYLRFMLIAFEISIANSEVK